ncbi:PREDICTED: rRNA methyltransferase 3, mitochondrial [Habropoda laboriosa]|uniref:rRNA methyltransferase 3, mitochondrial n=1 Tax=Habropoda laboriosa TaxID=597456 RepID=UPI00083CB67E|nr:PREDICTED: rRNA methyltransferase 3, mitochondrial [Habropoda laboriosa]
MVFLGIVYNTIRPLRSVKIVNLNITRTYTRWVSRRPVAILNEDELYDCEDTTEENIQQRKIPSRSVRKKKKTPIKTEEAAPPELVKKNVFTNLKENDKIITSLMTKLKSRKRREKANEIILEGQRLIKDAIKAGIMPNKIIFNDSSDIKEFKFPEDVTLYKVTYKTIQLWSSLITSPGLLGIFKVPDIQNNIAADNALPLTIICDNIREPGNLGSIMRVAAGVGCEKLIIMKGCVDLWDPKVLRSAAGTHFRLPIHAFPTWNQVPSLISENCNIFITDSNFGDEFISNYSPDMLAATLEIFDIDPEELASKCAMNNNNTDKTELIDNKNAMKQFMLKIPIAPYYSLDYTRKESVIILSGETEGLSYDSYKFLSKQKSIRINVPLVKGVDSLNTGVALGIVGFEIKRQFLKKQSQI